MWASFLVMLHTTVTLALIARVLIRPRLDPSVRLAWIMVIEALPVVGILSYILFGEVRMNQAEVQRMADVRDRLTNLRIPNHAVIAEPPHYALPVVAANAAVGACRPCRATASTCWRKATRPLTG
ncbi:PLDc N-terminal domain-containing protein [Paracoccus aerius]